MTSLPACLSSLKSASPGTRRCNHGNHANCRDGAPPRAMAVRSTRAARSHPGHRRVHRPSFRGSAHQGASTTQRLRCGAACAAGAPRRAVRGALDGCVRVCALLGVTARSSIHMHWPCVRVGCAPARPAGILQPIPPTEVLAEAAGASTAPEAADPNQVGPRPCCQPTKSRVARQTQTQRTKRTKRTSTPAPNVHKMLTAA